MRVFKNKLVVFIILLLSNIFSFNAEFIENKGILFTWKCERSLKEIQILYSPSGKNYYKVFVKRYSFPKENIKDTFLWVFNPVDFKVLNKLKEKAKIKIVYIKENNEKKEEILSLSNIKLSSSIEIKEKGDRFSDFSSSFDYGTYPNWPMFQVDPQHTGQYPYAVYPPLTYQWTYTLDYNDFLMISASISSNGVIYVGDGGRFLRAIDIKTGQILWERGLTANVWTTALVNDTLVLAGTSISFDTTMPTLFLLDARTGDTIWGRHFPGLFTVEFQPVVVDSLIYASTLTKNKIFCIILTGNEVWSFITDSMDSSPSGGGGYANQKVFVGGEFNVYSIKDISGDIFWIFRVNNWIHVSHLLCAQNSVSFFADSSLYFLNQITGDITWRKNGFAVGFHPTPSYKNNKIFHRDFQKVVCRDAETGNKIWERNVEDTIIKHIALTLNNLLFTMGDHHIYVLNSESGNILYDTQFPGPYESWLTPWFWPLIYGPYVIIAHLKNMYIYKGVEFSSPPNKDYFIFYPSLIRNQGYLYLNLSSSMNVNLKIFDISGSLKEKIDFGNLGKGEYFYIWKPKNFSQGIYFAILKGKEKRIKKFIILR